MTSAGKRYSPAAILGLWALLEALTDLGDFALVVVLVALTASAVIAEIERARLRGLMRDDH